MIRGIRIARIADEWDMLEERLWEEVKRIRRRLLEDGEHKVEIHRAETRRLLANLPAYHELRTTPMAQVRMLVFPCSALRSVASTRNGWWDDETIYEALQAAGGTTGRLDDRFYSPTICFEG